MLNNDEHNVERSDEILEKTHCCTPQKYLYRNFYFFKHNELKKCSTFLISDGKYNIIVVRSAINPR